MWPNNILNIGTNVVTVVKNIPNKTNNTENVENNVLAPAPSKLNNTSTSGKNPLVPGKPAFASETAIKKNAKIGIVASNPEKAVTARVWYLSDKTPTKKNIADDVKPWLNIR